MLKKPSSKPTPKQCRKTPLRRPPRLEGEAHKFGIKPVQKKSKKKS